MVLKARVNLLSEMKLNIYTFKFAKGYICEVVISVASSHANYLGVHTCE